MRFSRFILLFGFLLSTFFVGCISSIHSSNDDDNLIQESPSVPENLVNINQVWAEVENQLPRSPNGKNFIFERITTEQGLSQNTVRVITQDVYGFLWIGTDYGLNRFDGDEFIVSKHDPDDPNSISDNHIWAIHEDSRSNLWVGTDNGLNLYDRKRNSFLRFFHDESDPWSLSSNRIRAILEDGEGNIWIGTWGGGLDRFDQQSGEFIHYQADDSTTDRISDNFIRVIYEDSRGTLWVGTSNGLNRLNPRTGENVIIQRDFPNTANIFDYESEMIYSGDYDYYWTRRPIPLDTSLPEFEPQYLINNQIQTILEDDRERKIWIGTSGGLDCFNLTTGSFDHYRFDIEDASSLSSNLVLSMMIDQAGTLWVGTNNGLNEFDEQGNRFVRYGYDSQETDTTKSLNHPLINTIFQDRSGAIWVGTSGGGINRFDYSSEFFTHNTYDPEIAESVSGNMVWAFEEDSDIGYWVGTSVGVDRYNTLKGTFEHFPVSSDLSKGSSPVQIFTLHKGFDATIWAGSSTGLFRLDQESKQFVEYQEPSEMEPSEDDFLSESIILDIAESAPGHFLIGTYGSGLISLDINRGITRSFNFNPDNPRGISSNIVSSLLVDTRGITYIGTRGGGLNLLYPDSSEFLKFTSNPGVANSISDNNINQIIQARDGSIWIATMGGLNRFNPETNTFLALKEENGLPSNVIYGIAEDLQNNLWVASSNGITKIDQDLKIESIYQYPHGLQSNEFNPGASFVSNDGLIFFGGTNGFSVFRPERISINPYQPTVILGGFTQNREKIDLPVSLELTHTIKLEWPRNYFEFKVSNFNFIQRDKNLIAYRLVPLENDWTTTGSGMYQLYENLGGGLYTLEIKGANNDGIWGDAISAMMIEINPPFWEKRNFQLGAGLIFLILLFSGIQFRVRNVQKYSRTLEKEVQERTEDIEKRRKVAEGLREILVRMNSDLSLEECLDFVVCQTTRLIESPFALMFSIEEENNAKVIAFSLTDPSQFDRGKIDTLIEPVINDWAEKAKITKSIFSANINSNSDKDLSGVKIVPILSATIVLGGLAVMENTKTKMNDEDLNLLKSLADQAALAMENARLRKATEEIAVVSERNRIARDLHDAITQTLFSANLIAESLPQAMKNDSRKGEESLASLQNLNRSALAEMRALLLELRPAVIKDISLSELLKQMADTLKGRASVNATLNLLENFQLPEEVHFQFYRIAQEITTNIIKHSKAKNVEISLVSKSYRRYGQLFAGAKMIIADDGIGFESENIQGIHFGIKDIYERAELINASVNIDARTEKGTKITLEWKSKENQDDECK